MKYIFINPVVANMYDSEALNAVLYKNGYHRVEVQEDWHGKVKVKYQEVLEKTNVTVLDRRCPKAIELVNSLGEKHDACIPDIEPILIHCAMELAQREDLKGHQKVITTPCESLARHGNKLQLEDTIFISWKECLKTLEGNENLQGKMLKASPIPPGYFKSLGVKTSSLSDEEVIKEHFNSGRYKEDELVEMLYCIDGCNNGDGVVLDE